LEEQGQSREEYEVQLENEIDDATRRELILDEIAQTEKLKVTEDEFAGYYEQMSQMLQQPVEALIERLDAQAIHASLLRRKAIDFLLDQANITETDEELPDSEEDETTEAA
jgi:trigger factor